MLDIVKLIEALQEDEEGLVSYISHPSKVKKYIKEEKKTNFICCQRITYHLTLTRWIPLVFYLFRDDSFFIVNGNEV